MLQEKKTQTAFRLDPELLMRAKRKARQQNISLNRLVERAIGEYVGEFRFPAVEIPDEIPERIRDLSRDIRPFTEEELEADDRLAYILSK
jgi:hypothetical protein